jgi:hypothetical protein
LGSSVFGSSFQLDSLTYTYTVDRTHAELLLARTSTNVTTALVVGVSVQGRTDHSPKKRNSP